MVTLDIMQPQPTLGENARKIREEMGITVEQIAHMAKVSRQTVYNFENGKAQTLSVLREYLRVYSLYKGVKNG